MKSRLLSTVTKAAPYLGAAVVALFAPDAWAGGGGNMIQTIGDQGITMGTGLGILGATAGVMGTGAGVMMRSMPVIGTGAGVVAGSGLWIGARQIVQQTTGGGGGGAGLDDLHNIAASSSDYISTLLGWVF